MKSTIDPNIQSIIKASVDAAVRESVAAIMKANVEIQEGQIDYFKRTEKLLYSYPALKLSLAQYDEDIENGTVYTGPERKSADIIRYSSKGGDYPEFDAEKSKLASIERTRKEVQRIDRALDTIADDQYFDIIPMKYFDNVTAEEIAERLSCDERTYYRHKNRLVNKVKIVLFGADAL